MLSYSKGFAFLVFLKWMLCFFALNVIFGIVVGLINVIGAVVENGGVEPAMLRASVVSTSPWVTVFGNGAGWVVFMFWELHSMRLRWGDVLVWRANPVVRFLPVAMLSLGAAVLVNEVGNGVMLLIPMPDYFVQIILAITDFGAHPVASTLALVVIAPVTEEVILRGLVLRGMLNRGVPAFGAVVFSAFLFAIMHMNPWQGATTFLLGLLWGWIYLRTGSLALCVGAHAINNGLALLGANLPVLTEHMGGAGEAVFNPWWLNLAGVALLAGGLVWFRRLTREGRPRDAFAAGVPPPLPGV